MEHTPSKKILVLGGVVIVVLFSMWYFVGNSKVPAVVQQPQSAPVAHIKMGDVVVDAGVAKTRTELERGLSGWQSLGQNEGLLFVFSGSNYYRFWMKEMNFPLDIVWIDQNFKIVTIKPNLSPQTFPQLFTSNVPALYVLEVNAGFMNKHNIKEGDMVELLK